MNKGVMWVGVVFCGFWFRWGVFDHANTFYQPPNLFQHFDFDGLFFHFRVPTFWRSRPHFLLRPRWLLEINRDFFQDRDNTLTKILVRLFKDQNQSLDSFLRSLQNFFTFAEISFTFQPPIFYYFSLAFFKKLSQSRSRFRPGTVYSKPPQKINHFQLPY